MTVGKPISRLFVMEHTSTIDKLVDRGWLVNTLNDVVVTELGEMVMLTLSAQIILAREFPEYDKPYIDVVTSSAIMDLLNTWGFVSNHKFNGEVYTQLADEGVKACIGIVERSYEDGNFDDLLEACNEEKLKTVNIVKINQDTRKKHK